MLSTDSAQVACGARVCSVELWTRKKKLKVMRMDLERIRNLMSEVMGCVPGWNSSGAVKLGTSFSGPKK